MNKFPNDEEKKRKASSHRVAVKKGLERIAPWAKKGKKKHCGKRRMMKTRLLDPKEGRKKGGGNG